MNNNNERPIYRPKFLEKEYEINYENLVTTLTNIEFQLDLVLGQINSLNLNQSNIISYNNKLIPEGANIYFNILQKFYFVLIKNTFSTKKLMNLSVNYLIIF